MLNKLISAESVVYNHVVKLDKIIESLWEDYASAMENDRHEILEAIGILTMAKKDLQDGK